MSKPGALPSDFVSRIERIILSDEGPHMKLEDISRVKIAFAEGYMAGKIETTLKFISESYYI